jgi:hypothetical protein
MLDEDLQIFIHEMIKVLEDLTCQGVVCCHFEVLDVIERHRSVRIDEGSKRMLL